MPYQRFLDIHIGGAFGTRATFSGDVVPQETHQTSKRVAYRKIIVDTLSIKRDVTLEELKEKIAWVCAADSADGGKIRINAHGSRDGILSSDERNSNVAADEFAAYLAKHGLSQDKNGKPGVTTINLACCYAAAGPADGWMIRKFGSVLKMPGVRITGAPTVTRMNRAGVLECRYVPYVPRNVPRQGVYVPPHLRPRVSTLFKGGNFKNEYTYEG